jgi:hypothetical protein
MELLNRELFVMLFPVDVQRSPVVAIVNCPVRGQFIVSRLLKPNQLSCNESGLFRYPYNEFPEHHKVFG